MISVEEDEGNRIDAEAAKQRTRLDWIEGRGRVGAGQAERTPGEGYRVWLTGLLSFSGQTWVDGRSI